MVTVCFWAMKTTKKIKHRLPYSCEEAIRAEKFADQHCPGAWATDWIINCVILRGNWSTTPASAGSPNLCGNRWGRLILKWGATDYEESWREPTSACWKTQTSLTKLPAKLLAQMFMQITFIAIKLQETFLLLTFFYPVNVHPPQSTCVNQ